ncbi:hypothetical protein AAFF_G00422500 [Aldrovandia affinis]|uniref:Uncharacterized protein n=1 Tax=Aldrovandia affinis TaxID=143900 RepID=A0AAD7T6I3_9TELE|nr:hypothetical protein AAFF_G00422500 [Aldrovandia affinis]
MPQADVTSAEAALTVRWFCDQTGKTTDTQRSTLMRTRRKMLLNMLSILTKEVNLHMNNPNGQSDVAMDAMVKGRQTQNTKSENARLRYQVVLTDFFIITPEIQMTIPFPQTPSRKMMMLTTGRITRSADTVSICREIVP